jgi:catechol 2,3-dioxygenase-like lactoylglutathione lyase family enzyme
MDLAKLHVDVGVFTHALEPMLEFWQREVGLPFEQVLPLGGGLHQHRHAMNGSVFKLNHARDPLPDAPASGYRELWIARDGLAGARELRDPDGNRVRLVPRGTDGVEGIAVRLAVRDAAAFRRFYGEALGLPEAGENAFRCGDSLLRFDPDPEAGAEATWIARGYRYLTIQVREVDREHRQILARGGREGRAPLNVGDVARISFVRDPDGNWIEISQRASLTGPLPPDTGSSSLF